MNKVKTSTKTAVMDAFFKRHGIIKSWVCERLHLPRNALQPSPYGIKKELAACVEDVIHQNGKELLQFNFTSNNLDDIIKIHQEHGILLTHIAKMIGLIETSQVRWACQKAGGLTKTEKDLILSNLRESAKAMQSFQIPRELIRKEAA